MVPAQGTKFYPSIMWCGRNNISAPATIQSDIAAMAATMQNFTWVVISIPPGGVPLGEQSGGANYARLNTLNSDLATTYGARFFNVKTYLQGFGDGGSQDNADIAADLIPTSLRADNIHLNSAGYTLVAARLKVLMGL